MSDWRGGDDKQSSKKKLQPVSDSGKKVPANLPVGKKSGGWRKGGSTPGGTASGPSTGERSWQGGTPDPAPISASNLVRWLTLFILFSATTILVGFFIWWVFYRPLKLPLYIISVGNCTARELVETPFGNAERKALQSVNSGNIEAIVDESRGNDNFLSRLKFEDWLGKSVRTVGSGGPDRKLSVFYINSFAVERKGDLYLVPQSAIPWLDDETGTSESVAISEALRHIAEVVGTGSIGWMVLDIHRPPSGIAPQLQAFSWSTAVNTAYKGLSADLQKRVMITLACDDAENNWLAPEYQSTFFGYYFKRGLAGGFRSQNQWIEASSIGELKKALNDRVRDAVASRRYAAQNPVWIIPEGLPESTRVVSATSAGEFRAEAVGSLDERFRRMDELWTELSSLKSVGWRTDPTGYAIAESTLIKLEDLATWCSDDNFNTAIDRGRTAVRAVRLPSGENGFSLVAAEQFDRFTRAESVWSRPWKKLDDLVARIPDPSFARIQPNAPPAGQLDNPEQEIPQVDRGAFVWKWLVQSSRKSSRAERKAAMEPARLRRALEFGGGEIKTLELNFFALLVNEIDWSSVEQTGSREEGCAMAISCWERLQAMASIADPGCSWWTREAIKDVEQEFLLAFDRLLAGEYEISAGQLASLDGRLVQIESQMAEVSRVLETRDLGSRVIPSLVKWNIELYEFSEESELPRITSRLAALASFASRLNDLNQLLAQPPRWPMPQQVVDEAKGIRDGLESQLSGFESFFASQTAADQNAQPNPRTFRNAAIGLKSGLVAVSQRKLLHSLVARFIENSVAITDPGETTVESRPPARNSSDAVQIFLAGLDDPQQRSLWESLASGEKQFSVSDDMRNSLTAPNSPSDPLEDWRQTLMLRDMAARWQIGALAESPSRVDQLNLAEWPWSAGLQRGLLDQANQRLLQTERLAAAGWGAAEMGDLDRISGDEGFYFWQVASLQRPEAVIAGYSPIDKLVSVLGDQTTRQLAQTASQVSQLRVQFGKIGEKVSSAKTEHETVAEVTPKILNGVPEISLSGPNGPMPLGTDSATSVSVIGVDLASGESRTGTVSVDLEPWKTGGARRPEGKVAWRGNWRFTPINWQMVTEERRVYSTAFEARRPSSVKLTIKPPETPPVINVLLLVDCSNSMDLVVPRPVDESRNDIVSGDVKLFELVKERASALIDGLDRLQFEGEAEVHFGLMPFGLNRELQSPARLRKIAEQIYMTEMRPLDSSWKSDVMETVSVLAPGGETPLYDSAIAACKALKNRQGRRHLVYVLSDGVDFPGRTGLNGTATNLRQLLTDSSQIKLGIFQFDFFEQWIANELRVQSAKQDADPEFRDLKDSEKRERLSNFESALRNLQTRGIAELASLNEIGDQFSYDKYEPANYGALVRDLNASIPRIEVTVEASNGFRSEDSSRRIFDIPVEEYDFPATIDVTVGGSYFEKVTQRVTATGGENLTLQYRPEIPELAFPDFMKQNPDFGIARTSDDRTSATRLYTRMIRDNQEAIEYRFGFGNEPGNQNTFVPRPEFFVAVVEERGAVPERNRDWLLGDYSFLEDGHFPILRTPVLKLDPLRTSLRVRAWFAGQVPECVQIIPLPDKGELDSNDPKIVAALKALELENASISTSINGTTLTCTVKYDEPPATDDRLFVVAPGCLRSRREFDVTNNTDSHVMTLDDTIPPSLMFVNSRALEAELGKGVRRYRSDQ